MDLEPAAARTPGERYTPAEIERGLMELALCGGNTRRASRGLKERGYDVPARTLGGWMTRHADRYAAVRLEVVPQVHQKMAEESEDLAIEYGKVEREIIKRFREELPNLKAGEAANAMRNAATSKAIAVDKASLLRGRPTSRIEHKGVEETLRKLVGTGVVVIEGTAEEIASDSEPLPPAA